MNQLAILGAETVIKLVDPPIAPRRLSIALICPRFEPSFLGLEYALPLIPGDKRAASFPGALPLLAALVPEGHAVEIVDENVEALDFDRLRQFDVIGLTGMIVQRWRMNEILDNLVGHGPVVCCGGPYVTVDEARFAGKCDVLFIGEADVTWPQFLVDYAAGRPIQSRYEQAEPTEMTALPCPRYDLVETGRYLTATMQFSRGCPFLCEFCDIIVIFGRKPRLKNPEQIIQELDALLAQGIRSVFFVDDNFIGNKAKAKALLEVLVTWQKQRDYPVTFSTEATVNLADEPELLELLWKAHFTSIFIGIETPREASLKETRKLQNLRGDSLDLKLARIRDAGITIHAGSIVGFDHDDEAIFEEQFQFLQRNGIAVALVSVLSPIPSTPLYDRLGREGRLRSEDPLVWFEPKLVTREQLRTGYNDLLARLYSPHAFFDRVFNGQLSSAAHRNRRRAMQQRRKESGKAQVKQTMGALAMTVRLTAELARNKKLISVGAVYWRAWWLRNVPLGRDALRLHEFLALCARHWHCFRIAGQALSNWNGVRS